VLGKSVGALEQAARMHAASAAAKIAFMAFMASL
jgi:hypothetical protein